MMKENENENRETVADIVAEMRERADAMQTHGTTHGVRLAVLEFARRIEAAWELEARAIATENAVLPAVCITKKPVGNEATMREACTKMRQLLMLRGDGKAYCILSWDEFNDCQKMLRAALSAPARNCDTMSAGECKLVFAKEMLLHLTSDATENEKKLILVTACSVIDDLFAPATEKGATA